MPFRSTPWRRIIALLAAIVRGARAPSNGDQQPTPRGTIGEWLADPGASLDKMLGSLSDQTARLNFLIAKARCIFWEATVARDARVDGGFAWDLRFFDEAATRRVLPIEIGPGESFAEAWHRSKVPEDRVQMRRASARALEAGAPGYVHEFRWRRVDGEIRWLREDVHIEPVKPGRWRLVGVCTDVTERRLVEERIERLQRQDELILNSVADGIVVVGPDGRAIFANQAAARLTGHAVDEIVERSVHDLLHHTRADGSPYPESACPVLTVAPDGPARRVADEVFWRKDGSSFPVEYTVSPIVDPEGTSGVVITFQDVTERRAVDKLKDEFVSVVSHELRTPLTSIRGSLGLLASGVVGELTDQGQRMLEIAVNNSERLVRLINDILDIERMESGKVTMQKQRCDAAELIGQAIEVAQPLADKAGVVLEVVAPSCATWADPDRIVQTLTNLLSNAIKFSPAGSTVRVSVERQDDGLLFEVRDSGRGIPANKLESIFGRFQQVDASDSRQKGGTGLGLAICRSIVQQHGGRVWVDSVVGEGSSFFFTIPAPGHAKPDARPAGDGRPTVLLCIDDPAIRNAARVILERQRYRVVLAEAGDSIVGLAALHHPDAILFDATAPSRVGWENLDKLKDRAETRAIPIIVFSVVSPARLSDAPADLADWVVGRRVESSADETALGETLARVLGDATTPARILIVEDDADLAQVLVTTFQHHHVQATHAATGREAIEAIEAALPDLLVLDLVLPDGDGFAVVSRLRQDERLRQIPLVVYSARDLDPDERERLVLGSTQFFTKGRITMEDFERRVLALLDEIIPHRAANLAS